MSNLTNQYKNYNDKLNKVNDTIVVNTTASFAEMDANSLLLESLSQVVDKKWKIKLGYEDGANII